MPSSGGAVRVSRFRCRRGRCDQKGAATIGFIFFALAFAAMFVLAIRREPLSSWALWAAAVAFIAQFGVFSGNFHGPDMSAIDVYRFDRLSCSVFYRCGRSGVR